MQNLVNLFNQAIALCGGAPTITNPDAGTKDVTLCRLMLPLARRGVFCAYHWPSLRRQKQLALITQRTATVWQDGDPPPGYTYSYSLPTDCLYPQFLSSFERFDVGMANDNSGRVYTNATQPVLYFTKDVENPVVWAPDLYLTVVTALAANIAVPLSGKHNVAQRFEQKVAQLVADVAVREANATDESYSAIPQLWAGTGFTVPNQMTTYLYPTQAFRVSGV